MLRLMRDGNIDPKRRDAMARAALPFFHGRLRQANCYPEDPNEPSRKAPFEEFFQLDGWAPVQLAFYY
jgi:hypothetical protein